MQKHEIPRKALHLAALVIPLLYGQFGEAFLNLFFPLAALYAMVEILRLKNAAVGKWYLRFFALLLRPAERTRPSGAFYFLTGAVLTILLFPQDITVAALLVLAVSDPAAAFIGRRYGRRRLFNKTLAGSLAFFFSAWIVLALYFGANPLRHLPAALLGTLAEALPWPLNDNLTIPLTVGLTIWLQR